MSCDGHRLLIPRNGRRKFRGPVHVPSVVLPCTSRTAAGVLVLPGLFLWVTAPVR
jgi:hypothetical protein